MASKSIEKAKNYLWFTYHESTTGGEAIDPEYRWTYHEDEYVDFSLRKCYNAVEKVPDWLREQVDLDFDVKEGDTVHVVVVRYTTGGTFGRTLGYWYIEGVYKDSKEAEAVIKLIEADKYKGFRPWIGYFEQLEGVDYETMLVM